MPVFIRIANIIFQKSTIERKFKGGIKKFKSYYGFGTDSIHQEDDELFAIAYQNIDGSTILNLVENGLDFDKDKSSTNDFVILFMHGGDNWKVDWLENNALFAWHKDCEQEQIDRAQKIGNMLMDDFIAANERGENLFETIRSI